jgi:hypothetical protein
MATHVLSKNDDSINPVRKTDERGKSNRVNNGFVPMDRPDSPNSDFDGSVVIFNKS